MPSKSKANAQKDKQKKRKKEHSKERMSEVKQKLWKIKSHNKSVIESFNRNPRDSRVHAKKKSLVNKKKDGDAKKVTNFMKTLNSKQDN